MPVRTVRAGSNSWRMSLGQAVYLRSGTLNVASIVGFGQAAELARLEMPEEAARLLRLREKLRKGIMDKLDMVTVNGSMEHRLPGSLNISFAYVEGEALMMAIKDVAVSSGSACTSASLEPSDVLRAGDTLVVVGTREGLEQLVRILNGA